MKIKIKTWFVIVFVLGVLILTYVMGGCNARRENNSLLDQLESSQDSVKTYQVTLDGVLKEANQMTQTILTEREAKKLALIENEKLRRLSLDKITEITKLEGEISMLLDSISHNGQVVIIDSSGVDEPYIKLPFSFEEVNKFHQIYGKFDKKAKLSLKMSFPLSLDVTVGIAKGKKPTLVVLSDNPDFKIDKINSFRIVEEKKWYNSRLFYYGLGFGSAAGAFFLLK